MERITVKCPECGHRMDIDPKVIAFRCSQCGKKIDLDEEPVRDEGLKWQEFDKHNTAHTTRTVNDAEVIKARMEYEEKQSDIKEHEEFMKNPFIGVLKIFAPIAIGILGYALIIKLAFWVL